MYDLKTVYVENNALAHLHVASEMQLQQTNNLQIVGIKFRGAY